VLNYCYWCGEIAEYFFKSTNRWCCSKSTNSCPELKRIKKINQSKTWTEEKRLDHSKKMLEVNKNEDFKENHKKGLIKYFEDKNNRQKASEVAKERFINETPEEKQKRKLAHKKAVTNEVREKQSISQLNRFKKETEEEKKIRIERMRVTLWENPDVILKINTGFTIKKIQKKYIYFSKVEEMRYNPNKFGKKEIQVHCMYSGCENSKLNEGWFTPNIESLKNRIYAIEKDNGNDGSYFYCSDKCKSNCCLYNFRTDSITKKEIENYRNKVLKETYKSIINHSNKIKDFELRSREYHLDHKYSVSEGFKNNIDPKIIGHFVNLEVIPAVNNLEKSGKCSIELNELIEKIEKGNPIC